MKFTLSWLKDHLDTTASITEISEKLTDVGLEVESVTDASESLKAFSVAKIIEATRHPEADKLQVCKVQSNNGMLQIVCGAPNARAGLYVALAQEGAYIPGADFTIKKTKIRGVESNGMLCSFEELGVEGDSTGIIELPQAAIGSSVAAALGLDDPLFDIAITPNRADCLGVRGVARDLAAAGLGTLKPLAIPALNVSGKSPVDVKIQTASCQQFIGCFIKGVKNAESPAWLKKRLSAIGLRPISALVDITNYFTIDLACPLHVYDAAKLSGNITVRESVEGEKLVALNDREYTLPAGLCVIADEKAPVAVGGVIGGVETGCESDTTDVFLEVALFVPADVAKSGRSLQIDSDARYRFERGIDVAFVEDGAKLAVAMIVELCGGTASELVVAGKTPDWKRSIAFDADYVRSLSGVEMAKEKMTGILAGLGFTGSDSLTPPSWRADIEGAADLVEEIIRINGYDKIPTTPLPKLPHTNKPALAPAQKREHLAKRVLTSRGYMEVVSWSFISKASATRFGGGSEALQLLNPISEELSDMRPSLLPNLLDAALKNHNRGFKNVRLAEVGLTYSDITPKGQQSVAAGILTGINTSNHVNGTLFSSSEKAVDAMAAKADAMALLSALGVMKFDITRNTPAWYHPGRSGAFTLGGKIILASFGELHPALLNDMGLEGAVCGFEVYLDNIPTARAKGKTKPPLAVSDFQAVARDFAFVVEEKVSSAEIEKALRAAEKQLITDIRIFDVYAGKCVDDGKKSIAVQVTLQASDRTLSDTEIKAASDAMIASVAKATGGSLRA